MPKYSNATRWSSTHHVEIQTIAPIAKVDATPGVRPFVPIVVEQTHVFDAKFPEAVTVGIQMEVQDQV